MPENGTSALSAADNLSFSSDKFFRKDFMEAVRRCTSITAGMRALYRIEIRDKESWVLDLRESEPVLFKNGSQKNGPMPDVSIGLEEDDLKALLLDPTHQDPGFQHRIRVEGNVALAGNLLEILRATHTAGPGSTPRSTDKDVSGELCGEDVQSPLLARRICEAGRSFSEAFWQQLMGKCPLAEPISDASRFVRLTFIYRGNQETRNVSVFGVDFDESSTVLTRFRDTDLWYCTERVEKDARFTYNFAVTSEVKQATTQGTTVRTVTTVTVDPLNPYRYNGEAVVELPDAPAQPWLTVTPDASAGALNQFQIDSRYLKESRSIYVYTPPGYDDIIRTGRECGLLVLFDGEHRRQNTPGTYGFPAHVILDNLIAANRIPPMVSVMINNPTPEARHRDLSCSEAFLNFVSDELLPRVRKSYPASSDPRKVIVSGASKGGLASVWFGFKRPDLFGNVLAQSGSFWWPGWRSADRKRAGIMEQIAAAPRVPVRFYLETGCFEGASSGHILLTTRHLRDVLTAKGYEVIYSEFSGNHSPVNWRGTFPEALIALTKNPD